MIKLNKKGFTLIELLAVIVIIGILMMVAIPAVNRYINNSKKTTFINNAKTYLNAARTAFVSDQVLCTPRKSGPVSFVSPETIEEGTFRISFTTHGYWEGLTWSDSYGRPYENADNLVQSLKKSPWGSEFSGVVEIVKTKENDETNIVYKVAMVDRTHKLGKIEPNTGGIPKPIDVDELSSDDISKYNASTDDMVKWALLNISSSGAGYHNAAFRTCPYVSGGQNCEEGVYFCKIVE